jgi:hypothetical protein
LTNLVLAVVTRFCRQHIPLTHAHPVRFLALTDDIVEP